MLKGMEQQVIQIKKNLKIAHDRQKKYADKKMTPTEFKTGEKILKDGSLCQDGTFVLWTL
jgi:hypothetical protein